jgi:hypothetical protein
MQRTPQLHAHAFFLTADGTGVESVGSRNTRDNAGKEDACWGQATVLQIVVLVERRVSLSSICFPEFCEVENVCHFFVEKSLEHTTKLPMKRQRWESKS